VEKGEKPKNHIAIVEDITDKKEAEQSLKKSFDLVNEQNKRLLNFSYIVSHNLRSHSSNINSISNLLEDSNDETETKELTSMLKKVSVSLNETMSNLNDVINIQSNIHLTVENLNLHNYVNSSVNALLEQIHSKGATVINNVNEEITVKYNPAYLESILLNFISNSLKYSHPDRKPVVTIHFDTAKNELKISDNGLGIDLKNTELAFLVCTKPFTTIKMRKVLDYLLLKIRLKLWAEKFLLKVTSTLEVLLQYISNNYSLMIFLSMVKPFVVIFKM